MKRLFLFIFLYTFSNLAMESNSFNFESYLKENRWQERKDALTQEQKANLSDYLENRRAGRSDNELTESELGAILIDGLNYVEKEKRAWIVKGRQRKGNSNCNIAMYLFIIKFNPPFLDGSQLPSSEEAEILKKVFKQITGKINEKDQINYGIAKIKKMKESQFSIKTRMDYIRMQEILEKANQNGFSFY